MGLVVVGMSLVLGAGCEGQGQATLHGPWEPVSVVQERAPDAPQPIPTPSPAPTPEPTPEPRPDFVPGESDFVVEASVAELRRKLPTELSLYMLLSPAAEAALTPRDRFEWRLDRGDLYTTRNATLTAWGEAPLTANAVWLRDDAELTSRELILPLRAWNKLEMPPSPPIVPPAPIVRAGNARIAVISDSNGSYGSPDQPGAVSSAVDAILESDVDLVIHVGDMVAGQSSGLSRSEVEAMWDGYHLEITQPLANADVELIPVPGNHDADPALTWDRPVYIEEWTAPERRPAVSFIDDTYYPMAYSFEFEGSFFLVIDGSVGRLSADAELWRNESQLDWIASQLQAAQGYQYRFAFSHVPFDSLVEKDGEIWSHGKLAEGDALFDLFVEHRLDVFFTAHYHVYFKGLYAGPSPELGSPTLNVVATGRIGSGARTLIGQQGYQDRAFVLFDLEDGLLQDLFGMRRTDRGLYEEVFHDALLSPVAGNYRRFDIP